MNSQARRLVVAMLVPLVVLAGCTLAPESRRGFERVGKGIVNLLLSPVMIAAGLAEGLAFLPFTVGTNVHDLDKGLRQANAVSLDESYKATFGVGIKHSDVDPKSGDILRMEGLYGRFKPEALFEAQKAFNRLLLSQGMSEDKARHYVIVGNYKWAWSRDHVIFGIAYRHPGTEQIRVVGKETGIPTTLRPWYHQAWHEAYQKDAEGQVVDEIIDWAAMEYSSLRGDKVVATLLVIAVEAIKAGKKSPDFWDSERRWLRGDSATILRESFDRVKRAFPS